MTLPKSGRDKNIKPRKMYNAVKDAVLADLQLFHMSAPWVLVDHRQKSQERKDVNVVSKTRPQSPPRAPRSRPLDSTFLKMADQSHCKLLQLPADIRKQIWITVLGDHVFFGGIFVDLGSCYTCHSSNDLILYSAISSQKSCNVINLLLTCTIM
jgi:hypothetical protein